jgi:hypothetical protein
MRACIAVDSWKLDIFKEHLATAGYTYEQGPGLSEGTALLYVEAASASTLEPVVRAANNEAARMKQGH